jgi:hypothetical protein
MRTIMAIGAGRDLWDCGGRDLRRRRQLAFDADPLHLAAAATKCKKRKKR